MQFDTKDAMSATGQKMLLWIEHRLNTLRHKNDNDLNTIETSLLRGEIRGLKSMDNILRGDIEEYDTEGERYVSY
jgi:hypothetical protein